jgi:Carboxypeptidase regulatory-like domain/TonB-dependent Receptor Plug Domain
LYLPFQSANFCAVSTGSLAEENILEGVFEMKINLAGRNPEGGRFIVLRVLFCFLALALTLSVGTRAQDVKGDIRGTVTDEQGSAVAGAEVTVTEPATGAVRTTNSGSDGVYNFPDLQPGSYSIRASHSGFKATDTVGVLLHASDSLVFNIALKVGSISEQVTVEASAIQVETTNGELAGLINGKQVAELPLNGRNFMQLVLSVPGVAAGEGFSAQGKGLKGGSDLSISGGAVDANLWLVDGAHNNDVGSNRTILVFPSVDAIDEFKIERNSYSAQFGQSAGGQISIITKKGGNDFHGDVYYFGRNDALNTFNTFVKSGCLAGGNECVKNELRRNDFGYTVGGPIKKDKVFFFFSEEWNKQISGTTSTARVPTVAEKAGDFTDVAACPAGFNGFPAGGLKDPALHDPLNDNAPTFGFATPNVIPANRLSPVAQIILKAYPDPTNPDPCASNNFTHSFGVPTNWREESVRGDINLTKTLTAMMRFTNDSWNIGPNSGGFWGDNNLGPIGEAWNQPGRVVIGKLSKTIGQTAVNDFTFSYSANRITITPAGTDPGLVQQLNDSIPTFFPLSGKTFGDKGPAAWINCCGLPSVWTIAPWQNQQDLYTWQDDFSFVKGKHTIKLGALYARNYKAEQGNGEFGTVGGPVGLNGFKGLPNQTGYGIADLELLNMAVGWSETTNLFKVRNVWHDFEWYVADNFRITPRLTVDYGLRWSFLRNPYLSDDRYTVFNPAAFDPSLGNAACNGLLFSPGLGANPCPAGTGGVAGPNRALMNNNNHLIAPRLGIAWDPTGSGKWSVRAGVGQYFNRDRLWPLQIAGNNPPFNPSFNSPNGNGRYLDQPFTVQLPACDPNCYASGLGIPSIGQSTSDQMPNAWQWNLSVQREVFKDAKLELAYVANKNNHWEQIADVNFVPGADRLAYVQQENSASGAVLSAFRPFGALVGNNSITYYSHGSSSNYQSLQAFFNSRIRNHINFQAAYTWSKLLADSQRLDTPAPNVDGQDRHAGYGPDILNHPQIFSSSLVYELPALSGSNGLVRGTLGGWEASTIVSASSGPSITPLVGIQGLGDPSGVGNGTATGKERPDRVAGQPCRASGADSKTWLNPNMFSVNGFQLGQMGTAGVGICSGPPSRNVDFGLDKNFKVTERIKVQFRMEFFNLFNHPQYVANDVINNATINFNAPVFGDASGNVVPLTSATQILSATPAPGSNYGQAQNVRENGFRQIQYALKIIF